MPRPKYYDPDARYGNPEVVKTAKGQELRTRDFAAYERKAGSHKGKGTAKGSVEKIRALDYGYPRRTRKGGKLTYSQPPTK